MDRARIEVDFNELIERNLVLLSKTDLCIDSEGNEVFLEEGKEVFIYEEDRDESGKPDNLLAQGIVERNNPTTNGSWTAAAKWCCRIDNNSIYHESEINT